MISRSADDRQWLLWVVVATLSFGLLWLLGPILSPFLFAAILAYICNPLVDRLEAHNVPRSAAAALVLLLLVLLTALLVVILLPMLVRQFRAVAEQMPLYLEWVRTRAEPWLRGTFGVELDMQTLKEWVGENVAQLQNVLVKILPSLRSGALGLIEFALNLVLVPVVLFYLLRDWNKLLRNIDVMVPRRWHSTVRMLARDIDQVLGEFLRGQLLVMLLMGVFYIIGLWLVGLEYALSVGLIAGLLTFVPYLGVIIGVALATVTGLLQFDSYTPIFWIWGVFFAANMLEGYVFVPWLVGDRIGLHPVTVIFALLAFGQLFGFFGVLLALPASAALLVWLRYLRGQYLESGVYNAPSQ